jgi:DNA-binding MarR family transcriptional regulator
MRDRYRHPPPQIEESLSTIFATDDMTELNLFKKITAIAHLMSHMAVRLHKDKQMSPARMRLLTRLVVDTRLGDSNGLSPSELSDFLGVSRNTVSALLNSLEEQQLIQRVLNQTDRRRINIRITPAGVRLVDTHAPALARFVSKVFGPLSPEERTALLNTLNILYRHLREHAHETNSHAHLLIPEDPEPQA